MLGWIRDYLRSCALHPALLNKIELASEEVLVNIIHHAYRDQGGTVTIELEWTPHREVKISFLDHGDFFDPLAESPVLEEHKEGGRGIFLMRKCVDQLMYQRTGNQNRLTLLVFLHR